MYQQFFGFKQDPFGISPDPNFYCPTLAHNEALASLVYGIQKRKGFIVVTGEVGTGKTLLVQCLMRWLSNERIAFSHVFNTRISEIEFLKYVLTDFGLPVAGKDKSDWLVQLNRYLIHRHRQGSTAVLIVDEGQLLEWEVLEEIRLLTNLETFKHKLLQIVLLGQPELDDKLDSTDLRQLKQRIVFRCHLRPLNEDEHRTYVRRRLELAGATGEREVIFPEATLGLIYRYSRGIPRLVNAICENALIAAFAQQSKSISAEVIEQIASDLRLRETTELRRPASKRSESGLKRQLLRMLQSLDDEEQNQLGEPRGSRTILERGMKQ